MKFVAMDKILDIHAAKAILERRVKELEDCVQSDDDPELRANIVMDDLFLGTLCFLAGIAQLAVPDTARSYPGIAAEFGRKVLDAVANRA